MAEEVCNAPVLLDMVLWVWLQRMHHIRELDAITDEEHGDVVANKVKVALPATESNDDGSLQHLIIADYHRQNQHCIVIAYYITTHINSHYQQKWVQHCTKVGETLCQGDYWCSLHQQSGATMSAFATAL